MAKYAKGILSVLKIAGEGLCDSAVKSGPLISNNINSPKSRGKIIRNFAPVSKENAFYERGLYCQRRAHAHRVV